MRLLLVDDNQELASETRRYLTQSGFAVDTASDLLGAAEAFENVQYDLLLLDRKLPDGDGLNWLQILRRSGSAIPALIMSANANAIEDRVDGLNSGADDYVCKPVHAQELLARVRALLRRPSGALGVILTAGNVKYDTVTREITVNNHSINIPPRDSCILEHLMRRCSRVVQKSFLEEALYSFGQEVTPNAIEVRIFRLRTCLTNASASVQIRTIRGVGYMLQEDQQE